MDVIKLGPFIINSNLLILIISAIVAFLFIKIRLHRFQIEGIIADKFFNAMLIGFFTWKFSLVIFDPISVFQHPISLLYFDGGDRGVGLAIVTILLYVWIRTRKDRTPLSLNLELASVGWIAGSSMYQLLYIIIMDTSNILFHTFHLVLNAILLICLYLKTRTALEVGKMSLCWMWYSLGMFGIYYFQEKRDFDIAGFSKEQVVYFILFLIALLFSNRFHEKKE